MESTVEINRANTNPKLEGYLKLTQGSGNLLSFIMSDIKENKLYKYTIERNLYVSDTLTLYHNGAKTNFPLQHYRNCFEFIDIDQYISDTEF